MTYPMLALKRGHDHRLHQGHLWIYSNEIDTTRTPLKSFSPGDLVHVHNAQGQVLGTAYINPHCLLCARLLSVDAVQIDETFFQRRLQAALQLRERFYREPFYRLVFAESDGLPGLIIDRYDSTYVLQCNTAGMDRLQPLIIAALTTLLKPQRIVLRNDSSHRVLEGLAAEQTLLLGDAEAPLSVQEGGARFELPLLHGQKTGWFFDHRDNRIHAQPWLKGQTVLDVFSYLGGWSILAAMAGAKHVTAIDSSQTAIDGLLHNAKLNQLADRITPICADAFKALETLHSQGAQFDVIITDPPAFIKSKKDHTAGLHAYRKLNRLALQLLKPNGLLIAASCSMHLSPADLTLIIAQAAHKAGCTASIIAQWHQSIDHPVHPAIPETHYLKAVVCEKRI